jgi:hypothetical protein
MADCNSRLVIDDVVIPSEAKLQRGGPGSRVQRFQSRITFRYCSPWNQPEMFENLASCFAFRCSASLNMTPL